MHRSSFGSRNTGSGVETWRCCVSCVMVWIFVVLFLAVLVVSLCLPAVLQCGRPTFYEGQWGSPGLYLLLTLSLHASSDWIILSCSVEPVLKFISVVSCEPVFLQSFGRHFHFLLPATLHLLRRAIAFCLHQSSGLLLDLAFIVFCYLGPLSPPGHNIIMRKTNWVKNNGTVTWCMIVYPFIGMQSKRYMQATLVWDTGSSRTGSVVSSEEMAFRDALFIFYLFMSGSEVTGKTNQNRFNWRKTSQRSVLFEQSCFYTEMMHQLIVRSKRT